ncbi:methyltransferase domain-containing protein [Pleionea sediminis]|uniref:methyltransferase domain-containing protein n=1 Tax=Pleionea sediminis TaxID=2569479 RepID=UPI001186C627|nr:methyltransferase domain-containing protein [Pleionea sediminis]
MKYISLFAVLLFTLSGCNKPPEPKNEFEEAVYNQSRPKSDTKQDSRRKPAAILEFSQLEKGMKAADFMAGSGYYTELMAYLVGPNGQVFLHNVPKKAEREDIKSAINERLEGNRLKNVKAVTGETDNFEFPEKVDLILLSKVFHDFYVPEQSDQRDSKIQNFFKQLHENLSATGRVLVIDHSAPLGSEISLTSKTHRIDENFVKDVFKSNGFVLIDQSEALKVESDDKTMNIWESKVRNKTDRFVLLFEKSK